MVKNIVVPALALILGLSAAGGSAAGTSASVASVSATTTPTPAVRAREWLNRLQTGKIDRTQLTATVSAGLTDALVKQLENKLGPLGAPLSMVEIEKHTDKGDVAYVYKCEFANDTTIYFIFALDVASGKISGLRFTNAE